MRDLLAALTPARFGADEGVAASASLSLVVGQQLAAAMARLGLPGAMAAEPPPALLLGAPDVVGANYRAAYWLAVASRVASHRAAAAGAEGDSSAFYRDQAFSLYRSAVAHKIAADQRLAATLGPIAAFLPAARDVDATSTVLKEAAGTAQQAEISDVAAILLRLAAPEAIRARQAEVAELSGLRVLGAEAARALLTPEQRAGLAQLRRATVVYLDATREATVEELERARGVVGIYDDVLAKVAVLDRVERAGAVPLPVSVTEALRDGRAYVALLAQPVELMKRTLSTSVRALREAGSTNRDRVGFVPAVAAALGVGEGTVIVAVVVIAAVILLAGYYLVSQAIQGRVNQAYADAIPVLSACVSDTSRTPAEREACRASLRDVLEHAPAPPAGPEDLLWAAAALLGLGLVAWVASPLLTELSAFGASELSTLRRARAAGDEEEALRG